MIGKGKKDTRYIKHNRPISLQNVDYKLIEKCLAIRLRPALEHLIDEDQKGFLVGRRISCNIRRILDIMDLAEEEGEAGIILQIDFSKCFDRVEIPAVIAAMKYFNFGESYIKWTETIYKDAQSCMTNNGDFTEWFPVTRSVKQGGPNSPYLFLILAEVLAIELRKNPKIKGFLIEDIMKLFGQYADDIDLYLKGDAQSIDETLKTFAKFEHQSGFKINYEKTSVYRIGSIKKTSAKFYTKHKLSWVNDKIDVLGVTICDEKGDTMYQNYEPIVKKVETVLKMWQDRNLSLLGKVLIINSLAASLFIYKMAVLPIIPENYVKKLNNIFDQFLWNGSRPKVKIEFLQASRVDGGLGLVNLKKRDLAMKAGWVQTLTSDRYVSLFAYRKLSNVLKQDIWICNIKPKDVRKIWGNEFWADVLYAWSLLNYTDEVTSEKEIGNQFLWYNSEIRIKGMPVLFKRAYKSGLKTLSQLYNLDGGRMDIHVLTRMFDITIMECNMLFSAIPKEWSQTLMAIEEIITETPSLYDNFIKREKCVAYYYQNINDTTQALRHAYDKWNKQNGFTHEFDEFSQAFCNIYKMTNNAKLRSFQYRVLHSAIITNRHLFKWGIKASNDCTFCKKGKRNHVTSVV